MEELLHTNLQKWLVIFLDRMSNEAIRNQAAQELRAGEETAAAAANAAGRRGRTTAAAAAQALAAANYHAIGGGVAGGGVAGPPGTAGTVYHHQMASRTTSSTSSTSRYYPLSQTFTDLSEIHGHGHSCQGLHSICFYSDHPYLKSTNVLDDLGK